jgi:hypothetical protein
VNGPNPAKYIPPDYPPLPPLPVYQRSPSYVIVVVHADDECRWRWAVWAEDHTVLLGEGDTRSRNGAVRRATRVINFHARRRKDRPDWWWESTAHIHDRTPAPAPLPPEQPPPYDVDAEAEPDAVA